MFGSSFLIDMKKVINSMIIDTHIQKNDNQYIQLTKKIWINKHARD